MNLSDDFLKHATECRQMAESARDPDSKVEWRRMADRLQECAHSLPRNTG
jgi:hypothetical protein